MASLTRIGLNNLVTANLSSGTSITATEHRAVENALIDSFAPYNRGYVTLGNIPIAVGSYSGGGDLVGGTAVCTTTATGVLCTIPNTMPNLNYLVRFHIESLGTIGNDSSVGIPVFSIVSTTQFRFSVTETGGITQNIKLWFETIAIA